MKIGIVSLGCSKNLVDTQTIMTHLKASGHTFTNDPSEAEVIVVNTCGFISDAKEESINAILDMEDYKQNNLKYLIATGCLVTRYLDQLKEEMPEVDLWIPIRDYHRLDEILNNFLNSKTIAPYRTVLATSNYTSYLRISDGCYNRCAFCAIPNIRGNYHSEKFEDLLARAKELEQMGVKELNLIAQDSTRYGIDLYGRLRLADLLKELNKMDFAWIRILYLYPDEIDDELLDTMASLDKVVPYFDIPVQHANDRVLKLMNRKSSKQHIKEIVEKIRSKFDKPVLRTTLIVGYPTETEEEFLEMVDFIKEIKWDKLGAFTYSPEEDTAAYLIEPRIEQEVAEDRLARLMKAQEEISLQNNERFISEVLEVLVEGRDGIDASLYEGRSRNNAPDGIDGHVRFISDKQLKIGEIVKVQIESVNIHDLFGKLVD